MRLFVVFLYLVSWGEAGVDSVSENQLLFYSSNDTTIVDWAQKRYDLVTSKHIDAGGKDLLILSAYTGFGATRIIVYVYLYSAESKIWQLLLVRMTNTSKITVEYSKKNKEVVLFAKAGKKILAIPIEGIVLDFDPTEQ